MIGTEHIEKIIKAAILSSYVKHNDVPSLSLILVAPIEHGKTSLVIKSSGENQIIVSDVTGIGLLETLHLNPRATHVIINDLTVATGHSPHVSRLLITILNALAEEGCYEVALPRMQHLSLGGRRIGVIACATPRLYRDNRAWWNRSGFASRLLPVIYEHSIHLQLKIHQAIEKGEPEQNSSKLVVPQAQVKVELEDAEAHALRILSHKLTEFYKQSGSEEAGYRRHKQLRALARGLALMRSWRGAKVSSEDVQFIEYVLPHFMAGKQI